MKNSTLAVLFLTAAVPITVLADNPHFVGKVTAKFQGNNAQVCWKEAGLGSNQNIDYLAQANATASYQCVNQGGNCPAAANKANVTGPVSTPGSFSSGRNGSINACLIISPPSGVTLNCPGTQVATLAAVTYTNIRITDTTNQITALATPSTLQKTLFSCDD